MRLSLTALCLLLLAPSLHAIDREDPAERVDALLTREFRSLAAGIAFRAPGEANEIRTRGMGAQIVQYVHEDERWSLEVLRMVLERPATLRPAQLTDLIPGQPAPPERVDLMEQIRRQLAAEHPGFRRLHEEVLTAGQNDLGLIIGRYTQGTRTWFRQVGLLRVTDNWYYRFDLITPSGHGSAEGDDREDYSEQVAVALFNAILDSVELLDQQPIIEDNNQRLFRSRTLMVNLPQWINRAVAEEQFFRIMRDGRDVGWRYVVEERAERGGEQGLLVAVLSEGAPEPGVVIRQRKEMFAPRDRRSEAWAYVTEMLRDGQVSQTSESALGSRRVRRTVDEFAPAGEVAVSLSEVNSLTITQVTPQGAVTFERDLPEFYFSQAVSHMLPRLLPINDPKGYLVMVWSSDDRELIFRYLDVEAERLVTLGDRRIRAIPIRDRLGLEGDPTFHYISPEGRYLGSVTPSTELVVVAADRRAIRAIWPDAELERPRVLDQPRNQPPAPTP